MNKTLLANNQLIRLIVISVLLIVMVIIPADWLLDSKHQVCLHYKLFGFQCPLCGMTRAVHQFVHLRFATAVHYNIVVVLLPLYFITDISSYFYPTNSWKTVKRFIVALILIAFLFLYLFRLAGFFGWV